MQRRQLCQGKNLVAVIDIQHHRHIDHEPVDLAERHGPGTALADLHQLSAQIPVQVQRHTDADHMREADVLCLQPAHQGHPADADLHRQPVPAHALQPAEDVDGLLRVIGSLQCFLRLRPPVRLPDSSVIRSSEAGSRGFIIPQDPVCRSLKILNLYQILYSLHKKTAQACHQVRTAAHIFSFSFPSAAGSLQHRHPEAVEAAVFIRRHNGLGGFEECICPLQAAYSCLRI